MQARPELPERHRSILSALVREYIERGEPVSSLRLAAGGRFGLSSATVRNILADLEDCGYLRQPHTSAGRVPTDVGYRCYVDQLLKGRRPARPTPNVEARLREAGTVEDALSNASHELSRVSHQIGFALAPANESTTLHQIDFVSLGASKVLVVVIGGGGQICHKVVDAGESMRPDVLRQAASYLNAEFSGLPLASVRAEVLERLRRDRTLYDALMSRALRLASSTLEDLSPSTVLFIQGASFLLEDATQDEDRVSLATLRALLYMMEEKHRLIRLLNAYIDGPGLTVVIGSEHSTPDLHHFSLVASTYSDGGLTGTVGVIGPTRMRYSRAIAAVDGMAGALSRAFGK